MRGPFQTLRSSSPFHASQPRFPTAQHDLAHVPALALFVDRILGYTSLREALVLRLGRPDFLPSMFLGLGLLPQRS